MSRGLAHPQSETWVRVGSGAFGQAFRSERWGQSQKRALFLLGQAFRLETGSLFWPVILGSFGPAQELRIVHNVVCWTKPLLGS